MTYCWEKLRERGANAQLIALCSALASDLRTKTPDEERARALAEARAAIAAMDGSDPHVDAIRDELLSKIDAALDEALAQASVCTGKAGRITK